MKGKQLFFKNEQSNSQIKQAKAYSSPFKQKYKRLRNGIKDSKFM